MRVKYVLLVILMMTLMTTPAFAFWHPPPPPQERPPCTYFGVLINGKYGTLAEPYVFQEPTDNYCDTVTVEVFIANVTDLYGYSFELWWDTTYFSLTEYVVEATWPSQFVVMPDATYAKTMPYKQVVSAIAPSSGVTGDFKLATLKFHIDNDVCWPQAPGVNGRFQLWNWKASDSCSGKIDTCGVMDGYWIFKPVQPKIWIDPAEKVNSKVGENFTVTVWLANATKLHDFNVKLRWHGYQFEDEPGVWTAILCTHEEDVVINEEIFPAANSTQSITVDSPPCNTRYSSDPAGLVEVDVEMDPSYPLINGTFWLFRVTFTKCDPWYCGSQPEYTPKGDHDWILGNASTPLTLGGWLSVMCPKLDYIPFGEDSGICKTYGPQCAVPCAHPAYVPTKWVDDSYVNPDNVTHFNSIQHAIDAASANDVIEVLPGTYYGNIIVWSNQNLTIYARDGPTVTIVDASTLEDPQKWFNSIWYYASKGLGWPWPPPLWRDPFAWAKVNDPGLLRKGFIVLADGAIIDGFKIINARWNNWNRGIGILVGTISTTYTGMYPPYFDQWGGLIPQAGWYGRNASRCIIRNNIIDHPSDGIMVNDGSSNCIIECNTIIGADRRPDGLVGGDAIIIWQSDNWQGGGYTLVQNNIVHESYTAVKIGFWQATSMNRMEKFNGTRVTHNSLTGNYYGFDLMGMIYPNNGVTWDAGDPIMIDDNDLSDNVYGGCKDTLPYVDATKNWWGDRRGPGMGGASPIHPIDPSAEHGPFVLYDPWISCCIAGYEGATFTFAPIPGDLDGSGHVDITDVMIESGYYGYEMVEPWPGLPWKYITFYYDLNNDHVIDIYDVVIVAKNFCRTEPNLDP